MYCQRCGAPVPPDPEARFCPKCGAALAVQPRAPAESPPSTELAQSPSLPPAQPVEPSAGPYTDPQQWNVPLAPPIFSPVAPPVTAPPVPPIVGIPYGGFLIRLVAYLIDGAILSVAGGLIAGVFAIVVILLGYTAPGVQDTTAFGLAVIGLGGLALLIELAISAAYYVVLPPLYGATPGKLMLGYEIVDAELRRIGYGAAILRLLGYIVSGAVLYLGFIWIGIDDRKQGWHDKIASTFVVKREAVRRQPDGGI